MSIKTDLASIEILAEVLKSPDITETFPKLVHKLQNKVSYFDWVGLYLSEGEKLKLKAASDMEDELFWDYNSELRIPIQDAFEQELGKIVVRSKSPICFDITDISSLKRIASEISQRLGCH